MIARIVTALSGQYGLLAAPPNWDTEVKVTLDLPTDVSKEPITFNESRRNFAQSARYTMTWKAYLADAASSTELRTFLTRIRGDTVVVPMWPDACEAATTLRIGQTVINLVDLPVRYGSYWLAATADFSTFEFVTVASLGLPSKLLRLQIGLVNAYPIGALFYPLMFGKFKDRPKPEAITDECLEVELSVQENSAFAYRLSPPVIPLPVVGTTIPAFSTTRLWDIMPNHSAPTDWTEMPDVIYEHVGFLRSDQQRAYDHRNPRGQELEFYQNERTSVAKIELFWRDRRATTLRFMVPTFRGDLRMMANTPVPNLLNRIRCERSYFSDPGREAQPGDPFICLIGHDDSVNPYQLQQVVNFDPNETRLICTQNVAAFTASTTIVSHLMLARFAEATLEWTYTTPYLATTRIKFHELPHEYANTPVALPEPAYLFIFTEAGVRVDRYTSYENTVVVSGGIYGGVYVPAPFSFDTVKTGIRLDQEKLDFKSFKFDGNPLNKMWPFALDGILTLEIVEVDATAPSSATAKSRFYGDVWSVTSDYMATAVPFGNLFDRKFPRFLLSVSDNYTQFSAPTKLAASAFVIPAQIKGVVDHGSQTLLVTSALGFAKATDYFAGGWLETGTGPTIEKRGILHSAPSGTTDVTLTIDRPLIKAANNQTLTMYPGYDGNIDTCETKFNNRINFGGHAYIPDVNPGVKAVKAKNTSGGKKAGA